jgi:WD40 repeat protein/serine/threonine protein kinase
MGALFEARHRATGRRVAVKVIAIDRPFVDESFVHRFGREARAAGAVSSPHIAQVLDAGTDGASGEPYLVLELLAGEDLAAASARMGALPPDVALRIATQACLGLESAHAAGVIHRDVKPANLFLARHDRDVVVKVLDFGLAKLTHDLAESDRAKLTTSGVAQGSPRYMSPEQALGGKELDHRTDLWSLGVVLYELLTAVSPHEAVSAQQLLVNACTVPARPLRELAPWIAPELAALVHRAIERDPRARFASATEMLAALRALLPGGHALTATMFAYADLGSASRVQGATLPSAARVSPLAASLNDTPARPASIRTSPDPPRSPPEGDPLYPDYIVTGEQGKGGLGRVLRASDRRLGRTVAVKEMLEDDPQHRARFLREARLTARLEHPSIVPVYELGFRSDGAPFYAMKLVTGERLDVKIDRCRSLDERLALLPSLLAVTEAVAFAHERRIIHRDLKPANVILGDYGETVVIDWGLAKDLTESSSGSHGEVVVKTHEADAPLVPDTPFEVEGTLLAVDAMSSDATIAGHAVGTLAYMPDEQFRGESVNERADVFALGVSLYHLVAGAAPPAQRLVTGGGDKGPRVQPIEEREPAIPTELAAIIRKAMEPRPDDRYPTARELAADLRSFQTGQLVGAHRYTLGVLLRRWVVRHKRGVVTALGFGATLAVLGSLGVARIVRERDRAESARARADVEHLAAVGARRAAEERSMRLTLLQAEASLGSDPTATIGWLKTYPEDGPDKDRLPWIAALAISRGVARDVLRFDESTIDQLAVSPNERYVAAAAEEAHSVFVWELATGRRNGAYPQGGSNALAFSPDSSSLAAAGADGTILMVDPANRTSHAIRDQSGRVLDLSASPDGTSFASAGDDGIVRARSWTSLEMRVLGKHEGGDAEALAWAPDGRRIASTGTDMKLLISSLGSAPSRTFPLGPGGSLTRVTWSSDGHHVAAVDGSGALRLWDVDSGTSRELVGHHGWIGDIVFSRDGSRLLSGGSDTTVRVWDVAGKAPPRVLTGHTRAVEFLSTSTDGVHFASGGNDREVRVWNLETGKALVLRSRKRLGHSVFSRSGKLLATGAEGAVRIWDMASPPETVLRGHTDIIHAITWSPDGARMWTGSADATIRVWDAAKGTLLAVLEGSGTSVSLGTRLDLASTRIVTGGDDSKMHIWDLPTSRLVRTLDQGSVVNSLQASGDGHTIVSGGEDGLVRIWDATTGDSRVFSGQTKAISHIDISPDRALVLTASDDATIRVRELPSGDPRAVLSMSDSVARAKFSPNGAVIAGASREGQVRVWDAKTGAVLRTFDGYHETLYRLQFTPDSKSLVVAGSSGVLRICDLATGAVREIHAHTGLVRGIDISPDGSLIASIGIDGTACLWDFATGRLRMLRASDDGRTRVAFSPDGHSLAVAGFDALVHIYPIDPATLIPLDPAGFRAWLEHVSTAEVDADGEPMSPVLDAPQSP